MIRFSTVLNVTSRKFWEKIQTTKILTIYRITESVRGCRISISSQPANQWTAHLPRICRWIDSAHVNVLGTSILVKWTNPHAAQELSHKRGELSWLTFARRQPSYLWLLQVSAVYCYSISPSLPWAMVFRGEWVPSIPACCVGADEIKPRGNTYVRRFL